MRQVLPWLMGMLCALVVGCASEEEATGSAQVVSAMQQALGASGRVSQQALSANDVVKVELTVSGQDLPARTETLTRTGNQWGGVLHKLPVGTDRVFSARAYDAADTLLYAGEVSGVTITAGQTTVVTLTLQQVDAPPPFENAAPAITSLVASPGTVEPGGTVTLQAAAADANPGDVLTSVWTTGVGHFASASSLSTTWTAPAQPGSVVLTLTVTDSKGASTAVSLTIVVRASQGSAAINVDFNSWPQVANVSATSTAVEVGESTTLLATASDNDGDTLAYQWSSTCAGTWENASSASARFTPTAQPAPGDTCASCPLTVTVKDGRGGQTTGTLSLCVGPRPSARLPPEVVESYQSTASVPESDPVVFRAKAIDPQGSALSFSWEASTGTLAAPVSGADVSEVRWTAPACVPSGTSPSITVTVTNGLGLSARTSFSLSGGKACAVWSATGSMTSPRARHAMASLRDGRVLVMGGEDGGWNALETAEVYTPATRSWSSVGAMAAARRSTSATLLVDGRVLVVGGRSGNWDPLASAELYSPETNTWTSTNPMSGARYFHTATRLRDGRVLVVAGCPSDYTHTYLDTAEVYDPVQGTWSPAAPLAVRRRNHAAALLNDGRVLVMGGRGASGELLGSAEVYDPATNTWASAGIMATAREVHTATLLNDGRVLVTGGRSKSAEAYDPATNTWASVGAMATVRDEHTATLLNDGRVLVTGGLNPGPLWTAEVYDPATQTWSSAGTTVVARGLHTAALLENGQVLVAGGYQGHPFAFAELYTP